jgi:hypothetical protein
MALPHILFILADPMRPDSLSQAKTPYLDVVAADGDLIGD